MPKFRPLQITDLQSCVQLWQELQGHYDHPIGGDWNAKKLQGELETHHGLGAFDDSGLMEAFCLYRKPPGVRDIMLLVTRPRIHRTGAMRALIRSLIEDLAEDEKIWLEVHAGNLPAIGLYESLGFKLSGERKDYYTDGGKALLFEYKPLQ
jgi:ribosomal-protein-alanine N-acetyltransferase